MYLLRRLNFNTKDQRFVSKYVGKHTYIYNIYLIQNTEILSFKTSRQSSIHSPMVLPRVAPTKQKVITVYLKQNSSKK